MLDSDKCNVLGFAARRFALLSVTQVWRQRARRRPRSPGSRLINGVKMELVESEACGAIRHIHQPPLSRKLKWKSGPLNECRSHCPPECNLMMYDIFKAAGPARRFILNHKWTGELMWNSAEARLNEVHQTEYDDSSVKSEWIYKCIMIHEDQDGCLQGVN